MSKLGSRDDCLFIKNLRDDCDSKCLLKSRKFRAETFQILFLFIEIHSKEIPSGDQITIGEFKSSPLFSFGYYHKPYKLLHTSLPCNEQSKYDISFLYIFTYLLLIRHKSDKKVSNDNGYPIFALKKFLKPIKINMYKNYLQVTDCKCIT